MTDAEKLALVRTMTDCDDADAVLSAYLLTAKEKVLNRAFPFGTSVTTVPARYETLQCEIAAYLLNKRGAEGEVVHNENGINRSYESADVQEAMLSQIIPSVGVIT